MKSSCIRCSILHVACKAAAVSLPVPWRCSLLCVGILAAGPWAHALSIVVTPGSSAAYLYFPAQTSSAGNTTNTNTTNSTLTLVGVGGVSIAKSGGWLASEDCLLSCPLTLAICEVKALI